MPFVATDPGTVVDGEGTGAITPGQLTVISGGLPILTVGDLVAVHGNHPANSISTGSSTVFIGTRAIAHVDSVATCGGQVTTTISTSVNVGA